MTETAAFRRSPAQVMALVRLGSAHPTRLSFLRHLLRRMASGAWRFERFLWEVDANGVGCAIYRAIGPERCYSLVAFAHDLPPDMRSDRVIATAWDATFALFDGTPTATDLNRLQANVPLQEAGRISPKELSLSRANRSVRLFSHVLKRLAQGLQPEAEEIAKVGYLMRTTAVYGSGKFGAADHCDIAARPELDAPFQAEMLSVWMTRQFTVDLVEHLARAKGGTTAVRLAPKIKQKLGVGNSTGLGMAPFLIHHPVLLHHWITAKEEALARVRAQEKARTHTEAGFQKALLGALDNAKHWHSQHPIQAQKLVALRTDLDQIKHHTRSGLGDTAATTRHPWDALWRWGEKSLGLEGQEALLGIMLEPHGDLVDDLCERMSVDEAASFAINGAMTVGALRDILTTHYDWALRIDFSQPENIARFWYVSEEKLEPRVGNRFSETGAERELPLTIGLLARQLADALPSINPSIPLAQFLSEQPQQRYMARRAQRCAQHPFAEVHGNLAALDMLPIDLLRCKLAFFGASQFDPQSDKWVRINLFHGQVFPSDLNWQVLQ